jgi:hypothetical protein
MKNYNLVYLFSLIILTGSIYLIVEFRDAIPASVKSQTDPYINNMILKGIAEKKTKAGAINLAEYVKSKTSK